jgi:5-methylcytosine-specific restriction endonuclease McrA
MSYSPERLRQVYDKTGGYCEYCGKKIAFKNYGKSKERGSWEVDHSIPLSRGGTDNLNNLFPTCTDCNREKGDLLGSSFRRRFK